MARRTRGWVWTGRVVAAAAVAGLGGYLSVVGLDEAGKIAAPVGLVIALAALLAPYLLPVYQATALHSAPRPGPVSLGAAVSAGQVVAGYIPREPAAFVMRETVERLAEAAGEGRVAVLCSVTGLRGVGKTQVAGAYARARAAEGWGLVGWVNAETRNDLLAGLERVAEGLGVADPQGDREESAQLLRDHLQGRSGPGLLVFDNAGDPNVLKPFLPTTGGTQIVVTSTNRSFDRLGTPVDISVFARPESVRYLQARIGPDDERGADAVAGELGDLPLALAQAAAVIAGERFDGKYLTYAGYLERLRRVPVAELLGRDPDADGEYPDYPWTTAAALLLSVAAAESADPGGLTGWLLRVVAALSPDGVPRKFLDNLPQTQPASRRLVRWPRRRAQQPWPVDKAVAQCVAGSLLDWSADGDAIVMHRLVARVLRERDKAGNLWTSTVTGAMDLLEPLLFPEEQAWSRREDGVRLAAQIEPLREADIETRGQALAVRLREARFWADRQLSAEPDQDEDINEGTRTLTNRERVMGTDHPDSLAARDGLARAYCEASRPTAAIPLYEQNLASRERLLGADHPDTLASRDILARACQAADRPADAIPLYEQSLTDRERLLGADDLDTVASRDRLASCIDSTCQGGSTCRYDRVIVLYEQSLASLERVQGADHPDTLAARDRLASSYDSACGHDLECRHDEAILLYEQTVADRERVLGADAPDTLAARDRLASSYESLASSYDSAGRSSEAVPLHQQAQATRDRRSRDAYSKRIERQESVAASCERARGADHPDTLAAWRSLAHLYYIAGRFDEAVLLYGQTLASQERLLGTDHRDTSGTRESLLASYLSARRFDEAILLEEQTVGGRERLLGADHPQTRATRRQLAGIYEQARRYTEAIRVYEQIMADSERLLGADHADTLTAQDDLAYAYQSAGRHPEAIRLYKRTLDSRKSLLGKDHADTITSRNKLEGARTKGRSS